MANGESAAQRRIGVVPAYYCAVCFEGHRDAILANVAWAKCTMHSERQRRKRRNRLYIAAQSGGQGNAMTSDVNIIAIIGAVVIIALVVGDS